MSCIAALPVLIAGAGIFLILTTRSRCTTPRSANTDYFTCISSAFAVTNNTRISSISNATATARATTHTSSSSGTFTAATIGCTAISTFSAVHPEQRCLADQYPCGQAPRP
mmetsp:Transcript_17239/g.37015  ORF Transcript_17239/g.37015 Transcript_17239/m.37015 type:complete len:111 (+) Transcript_17239:213-545(+)